MNGDRIPDALGLLQIAEKCHVSVDWLIGLSNTDSLDAELRQVCDYTGLSRESVGFLSETKECKSRAVAVDFVLKQEDFLIYVADYLASSAWESVVDPIIGWRRPTAKTMQEYEENRTKNKTIKVVLPPLSDPIVAPFSEEMENLCFASAIKELTKMHGEFSHKYCGDKEFVEELIKDYVAMYNISSDE